MDNVVHREAVLIKQGQTVYISETIDRQTEKSKLTNKKAKIKKQTDCLKPYY